MPSVPAQSAPQAPAAPGSSPSAPPAASDATTEAAKLFEEGRALKGTDPEGACAKFEASLALARTAGTLFNLAVCDEEHNRFGSAARRWNEGLRLLPADDSRREKAAPRAREAESKAGVLVLTLPPGAPAGTAVTLDARPLSPAELGAGMFVDAGEHRIELTAPGHERVSLTTNAAPGARTEVPLKIGPATSPPSAAAPPPSAAARPPVTSGPGSPEPGFFARHKVSMAIGIPALAVGFVGLGVVAGVGPRFHEVAENCNKTPGSCTQADFDPVKVQANVGNVLLGVAAAGLAAAGIYFIVQSRGKPAPANVSFTLGPYGGAVTVRH